MIMLPYPIRLDRTDIILNYSMPDDHYVQMVDRRIVAGPVVVANMLRVLNGFKYWDEPYKAVFAELGFNDRSLFVCVRYAKWEAEKNIDKLFAPLLAKYAA